MCNTISNISTPKARSKREASIGTDSLDALGNKSLLERKINIIASDYRFQDKKKYYLGKISDKNKTNINELRELAKTHSDFTEQDINARTAAIIESFISFIKSCGLTK